MLAKAILQFSKAFFNSLMIEHSPVKTNEIEI